MAGLNERPPFYLSPRSADVVLSEIRPTKLAQDALRSVNVLLDELMWMILSTARSFATDQIKSAMGKLLPTVLGKEALLEAEVELHAYWDRTTDRPSRPYTENPQDFPIQPAFELLRLKCEAYSTFNDTDEDEMHEKRWQSKVTATPGFAPHNTQYIAPAALYLTAVIEHVCEHILSNTGRVASRDSSRSTATLLDFYTALCEDDTIYGLFKIMKVHSQIEAQCKTSTNKPKRSKSFTRSTSDSSRVPSRSDSPYGETGQQPKAKTRESSEADASSTNSGPNSGASQATQPPAASEKSMTKKIFGRMSIDKESGGGNAAEQGEKQQHKRTASIMSGRRSSIADDPGSSPSEVEFDELMRSGATMKVSLTPDRLRTFEVFSKDKSRGPVTKIVIPQQQSQTASKTPLQNSLMANSAGDTAANNVGMPSPRREPSDQEIVGVGSNIDDVASLRSVKHAKSPPSSYEQQVHARSRSTSNSTTPSRGLGRKASLSAMAIESPHSQSLRGISPVPTPTSTRPKASASITGTIRRTKSSMNGTARGSIDDILASSDDESLAPLKKKPPVGGRRRAPTVGGVSENTLDLIDFLNSGPPDLPKTMSASESNNSNSSDKQKRGRLRSIVSRFKQGSTDRLASQASLDELMANKASVASPPSQFIPPRLSAKRSLHSLQSFQTQTPLNLPKPPPPPPVNYGTNGLGGAPAPLSPPQSPSAEPGSPLRPRASPSTPRKAVPMLGDIPDVGPAEDSRPPIDTNLSVSTTPSKRDGRIEVQMVTPSGSMAKRQPHESEDWPNMQFRQDNSFRSSPKPKASLSQLPQQRQAASPPPTPEPSNVTLPASNTPDLSKIVDMRRLLANATTADECRLLVDMFLAQSGMQLHGSEFQAQLDPASIPTKAHEDAVVETLLGNGPAMNGVTEKRERADSRAGSRTNSGAGGKRDLGALSTPRSDEYHGSGYRKPMSAHVVSAEA